MRCSASPPPSHARHTFLLSAISAALATTWATILSRLAPSTSRMSAVGRGKGRADGAERGAFKRWSANHCLGRYSNPPASTHQRTTWSASHCLDCSRPGSPMPNLASLGTLLTAPGLISKTPVVPTLSTAPVASVCLSTASASSAPARPASFLQPCIKVHHSIPIQRSGTSPTSYIIQGRA